MENFLDLLKGNKIILAPMAGVTNQAYRLMAKKYGVGMVYSEMISDKGIFYKDKKTFDLAKLSSFEHPIGIQIFGGDIDTLVLAAKYVDSETNADFIDINMGCPVPKVLKAKAGSDYLKDPERIYKTVSEIVKNVSKPVTVKVRIGYDHNTINIFEVVDKIIKAGASAVAIHGRCKVDMYANVVHYDLIKKVKELHPTFPIIANGDIDSPTKAKEILEYTKADAIMVGRATYGNFYIIKQMNEYINNGILLPDLNIIDKLNDLLEYTQKLIELKGEEMAIRELRGQAGWFVKGIKDGAYYRNMLSKINTYQELLDIVAKIENENPLNS